MLSEDNNIIIININCLEGCMGICRVKIMMNCVVFQTLYCRNPFNCSCNVFVCLFVGFFEVGFHINLKIELNPELHN